MPSAILEKLDRAFGQIDRPGTFCASGSVPAVLPGLEVEGLGPVGLPLTAKTAKDLIKHCHQAPYGKGEKTLVDTKVRRVWRMEPDHFALENPDWDRVIKEIVGKVQEELGLESQKLESHLYDLLLYEPGSFFLPHRDGEKLDRMVATLVVVLALVVRGRRAGRPPRRARADDRLRRPGRRRVPHPLRRVLRRLRARGPAAQEGASPLPGLQPDAGEIEEVPVGAADSEHIEKIAPLVQKWADDEESTEKLAITLDHQYTQDGLRGMRSRARTGSRRASWPRRRDRRGARRIWRC